MSGRHARVARSPVVPVVGVLGIVAAGIVGALALRDGDASSSPAAGGGTATGSSSTTAATCPDAEPLRVLVTPEMESIAAAAAGRVTAADACQRYAITSAAGTDALTQVIGDDPPRVWVPDSTTWLDALPGDQARRWVARNAVATSPIGLATSPERAGAAPRSWADVVRGTTPVQLADPDRDASSRLAVYTAMAQHSGPLDRTTGARLILMSRFTKPSLDSVIASYAAKPASAATFPISERAAFAHDATGPKAMLGVTFPTTGTAALDYPWLNLAGADAAETATAEALRAELTSPTSRDALATAGFRAADGRGPGPVVAGRRGAPLTVLPVPSRAHREQAAAQWHVLRTDMRMLAVIDVSGSMRWRSGTPGMTRMDVLLGSADRALQTLATGSKVGAWIFSTAQDGPRQDWRELAPLRRLDATVGARTQRNELRRLLTTVPGRIRGDTGLYDTTLAAFDHMLRTYEPNYVNSVVLMTDGVNDDTTGGISLQTLLARLKEHVDPARPVRVVTIGMGEADARALKQISAATGGTSYIANTPADIDRVLVQALLARPLPVGD